MARNAGMKWKWIGLAVLAIAAVALAAFALSPSPQPAQAVYVAKSVAAADPTPSTPPTLVAFIGDSYTAGSGSTQGGWVDRVASRVYWQFKNNALGGTGYLNQSSKAGCGLDFCPNYSGVIPAVAKESPTMVVVSGGRNDTALPIADVEASITKFYQDLHAALPSAKVVALSPVWDATAPPAVLTDVASTVRQAVTAVGGTYVDIGEPLAGHPELMSADKVHPNDNGHEALAVATTKALRAAGLVQP